MGVLPEGNRGEGKEEENGRAEEEVSFEELGVDARLVRALSKKVITEPTLIQREAIPLILERGRHRAGAEVASEEDPPKNEDEWGREPGKAGAACGFVDESWEELESEPEAPSEEDPPKDEDEWGREPGKARAAAGIVDDLGEETEPEVETLLDVDPPRTRMGGERARARRKGVLFVGKW